MKEKSLSEKVALVTGGSQGLGKAIVRTLAEAGATVVIGDVQLEKAKDVAAQFADQGLQVEARQLDVSAAESVKEFYHHIEQDHQRVDILINNAGVDVTKPVKEMEAEEWQQVISVNLNGPFLMTKAALKLMVSQHSGNIINIASTAAKRGWPNASAYHASKWGLLGFSRALFTEARDHNIKVTAVVSGGMKTPFLLDRFPEIDKTKLQDPGSVAQMILAVLNAPEESVIPEILVMPLQETSWP